MQNSLGMELVEIPSGSFRMGQHDGEWDEQPVHRVTISQPFHLSSTPVTNAQYELFDPEHRQHRGRRGLSSGDDEAVVHVSWYDAVSFCRWLTEGEGRTYRLPTEAEWEYACRAGTDTAFNTGNSLPEQFHRAQAFSWDPEPVDLTVGKTPANHWGLHDMHGLVEEWCHDWYGPYPTTEDGTAVDQVDPVGHAIGSCHVSRGGSHNTEVAFLRSANRMGTLPEDRHWLLGFRVASAERPVSIPLFPEGEPRWAIGVSQTTHAWGDGPPADVPYFEAPIPFVGIQPGSNGPLYSRHNHCPAITWCANGDLLAIWFSTNTERGREMTIAASRFRRGGDRWDAADEFFKAPDRNMTGSALFHDGNGTISHFNGLEAGHGWANLALVMRVSGDNGATWSTPRFINPEHQRRNQVIAGTSTTVDGHLIQPCDAVYGGNGGTAIHVSTDGGRSWTDPGAGTPKPDFNLGTEGGTIAGIHGGVVSLRDGRLLAFGRGDDLPANDGSDDQRMPASVSDDLGKTWRYAPSPWPPINGGQRLILMRLREGPLLFVCFTDSSDHLSEPEGMVFEAANGDAYTGYGLYAALSFDEGETWPGRKLLTPGEGTFDGGAWTRQFEVSQQEAEPKGYLAATQTPDGTIHLVSSALHYRFNLSWLKQAHEPPPAS